MNKSWILTLALGSMVLMMFLVGENNPSEPKSPTLLIETLEVIEHGHVTMTEQKQGMIVVEYAAKTASGTLIMGKKTAVARDVLIAGDECEIVKIGHKDAAGKIRHTVVAIETKKKE